MIRIEGIPVVAARLAAELKSTKTVKNSTRFRQRRMRPSLLAVPQQQSRPRVKADENVNLHIRSGCSCAWTGRHFTKGSRSPVDGAEQGH